MSWRRCSLAGVACVTLAATVLMVAASLRYLSLHPNYAFLLARAELTSGRLWRTCFYVHIAGGLVCLLTAPLLL